MPRRSRRTRPRVLAVLALVLVLVVGCLPAAPAGRARPAAEADPEGEAGEAGAGGRARRAEPAGWAGPAGPGWAESVPFRMDASNQAGWWRPIDEHDGRVYAAYNGWGGPRQDGASDTHTVHVARRGRSGTWSRGCLPEGDRCAVYRDDVGHHQPTVVVDGDGHIHVFASMHGHGWRYFRSAEPDDPASMVDRSAEMPGRGGGYTYPIATRTPNGDVYLAIRKGSRGFLHRWDDTADRWSRVAMFAGQRGYVVYPDDIASDAAGNVHVVWEWAHRRADGLRHLGSHLRYEPDTGRFRDAAGRPVSVPAGIDSTAAYQPVEAGERITDRDSPAGPPGMQSAKVALDPSSGRPTVAYRYRRRAGGRFEVRVAEWDGERWRRQTVHAGDHDTHPAVDVTLTGGVPRVFYTKVGAPGGDQAFLATRRPDGRWVEAGLAPGVPVERLSVVEGGSGDHLYLAAPSDHLLTVGRLPPGRRP